MSKSRSRENMGSPTVNHHPTTPPRWLQTRTRASFPVRFPFHSASGGHLIPECPKPCIEAKCHFLISQSAFRKQMRQELFFHLGVYVRSNALCFWNCSSRCICQSDKNDAHHRRGSVRSCLYVWGPALCLTEVSQGLPSSWLYKQNYSSKHSPLHKGLAAISWVLVLEAVEQEPNFRGRRDWRTIATLSGTLTPCQTLC